MPYDNPDVQNPTLSITNVTVLIPPDGTVAANGTSILGVALPRILSSGCWMYLPANAVGSGASQAGFYWTIFSSTTVCQVYTAYRSPSVIFPDVPTTSLIPAVGSAAPYVIPVTPFTVFNFTIPANSLGINGIFKFNHWVEYNNSVDSKIYTCRLGSTLIHSRTRSNAVTDVVSLTVRNTGTSVNQLTYANNYVQDENIANATSGTFVLAINTGVDMIYNVQLTAPTLGFIMLSSSMLSVFKSN